MENYAEVEADEEDFATPELPNFNLHATKFDTEHPELISEEEGRSDYTSQPQQVQYAVPEVVKQFVSYFYRHIKDRNVYDIYSMYENTFNKITEKWFKNSPWPPADSIAPLVHGDTLFMILYKELYFRHIYNKLEPSLDQRIDSWKNYSDFFNYILNAPANIDLELPNQWLWDIIDEFIYQFQVFCQYRAKLKNKSNEELNALKNNPQWWNVNTVINYLQALIDKSGITQSLDSEKRGTSEDKPNEFVNNQIFKMLGYFSIIGLLRVHCLLGDYHFALKTISAIELNNKGLYTKVTACHITLYYYLGFVYLMMRRYVDAIRTFAAILIYISRTKQYHTRSYQYEQILKKNEQMYGLLAVCVSLCPQRVDENVHSVLRDKYSDKMQRMQKGDLACFEELFSFACPKFVSAAPPPFALAMEDPIKHGQINYTQEALKLQTKLFLSEVSQQVFLPTIRSYLKLYTTISVQKLAQLMDMDEQSFRTLLLCYKHKTRGLVWNGGAPINGELASFSDVDFYLEKDMIHINDTKVARRYSEFFIRHTDKLLNLLNEDAKQ